MCHRPRPDRADLGELARMLQAHTPMHLLSDMQVRGWKITKETIDA